MSRKPKIKTFQAPKGMNDVLPNVQKYWEKFFKIAKELMTEIITAQKQIMADSLNQAISSHLGGNRISKIWRILRGKL